MMFADDIALLADSVKGLQESKNKFEEFCRNLDLSINIEKQVIFNKPSYLWLQVLHIQFAP